MTTFDERVSKAIEEAANNGYTRGYDAGYGVGYAAALRSVYGKEDGDDSESHRIRPKE